MQKEKANNIMKLKSFHDEEYINDLLIRISRYRSNSSVSPCVSFGSPACPIISFALAKYERQTRCSTPHLTDGEIAFATRAFVGR